MCSVVPVHKAAPNFSGNAVNIAVSNCRVQGDGLFDPVAVGLWRYFPNPKNG